MRTVLKTVIRSVSASASAVSNSMSRENQLRVDFSQNRSRKDFVPVEILNSIPIQNISTDGLTNNSLSPSYKLTLTEESSFEELLDKECDYYPDNSVRGDMNVLNKKIENLKILSNNVNSENITDCLKNIRFVNSIIFNQSQLVFLITANYIQRLLYKKAVKKSLMHFIATAVYDIALEHQTRKALTPKQISLLLSVSNIPLNHIEDFSRIKQLLLENLNDDLDFITITDYLQVLLKVDVNQACNLPESHVQLIDIACVLATSCELTHFTLACQAISLVNLAARHVSLNQSFLNEFSDIIKKFPLIFLSPVRLNKFANVANVDEHDIQQCTESMIRYFAKYYRISCRSKLNRPVRNNTMRKGHSVDKICLATVIEEAPNKQQLNINELMEKLSKVKLSDLAHIGGKQKRRQKRIKKNISRQLKKYGKYQIYADQFSCDDFVDDEDSAISSSSNMTSPSNSPLTF